MKMVSRYGEQFERATRQTGSILDNDCPRHERRETVRWRLHPTTNLFRETTVHEAGRVWNSSPAFSRHHVGCRRWSTTSDNTARRRTSDFGPDDWRQATTWRPEHGWQTARHDCPRRRLQSGTTDSDNDFSPTRLATTTTSAGTVDSVGQQFCSTRLTACGNFSSQSYRRTANTAAVDKRLSPPRG